MIKKIIISLVISMNIMYASSNSASLNVNSNTLELSAEYSLNDTYNLNNDANYMFILSYLGSDKNTKTKSSSKMLNTGLKIDNPYINDYGFSIGFGLNIVWLDNYNQSFLALPLSIYSKYTLNDDISFNAKASYSPKVLSFSDAKNFTLFDYKANYKVIDNGYVYIGKRYIKSKYTNNVNIKFDDSVFFGFKVLF